MAESKLAMRAVEARHLDHFCARHRRREHREPHDRIRVRGRRPPGQFRGGGEREVTYWIDRARWGRSIATRALRLLLAELPTRPLHARAAADNAASIRVLTNCGFVVCGTDRDFAQARGAEIDEVLVRLDT